MCVHTYQSTLWCGLCAVLTPLCLTYPVCVWTVFVYSSEILATAAHFIAAAIVICVAVVW